MIAVFSEDVNEIKTLMDKVEIIAQQESGSTTLYTAKLNDKEFVIVESGYGKVNMGSAAAAADAMFDEIDTIIGLGDCGVLRSRGMDIGSVAVSETSRQYDVDFSALGYEPSLIIGLSQPQYPCDETLIALAKQEADALGITSFSANFGSADRFLADGDTFYSLSQQFGFDTVDTETGALGQYAFINGIPYVYVKGVSNYGDDDAAEMYYSYRSQAYAAACHVVYQMLDTLTGGGVLDACTGGDAMSINIKLSSMKELTKTEILALLPTFQLTRLSVSDAGQPYTVPMAYALKTRGDKIAFCLYSKRTGMKMHCIEANSKVCLEFDKVTSTGVVSVVVFGTATVTQGSFTSACNRGLDAIRVTPISMTGRSYGFCPVMSEDATETT